MFKLLLFAAVASTILAVPLVAVALLCRIRIAMDDEEQKLSLQRLYCTCWLISLLYNIVAYQGYGGYMIIALMPLSMYALKLNWLRATIFAVSAGLILICATLLLTFVLIFGGLKALY